MGCAECREEKPEEGSKTPERIDYFINYEDLTAKKPEDQIKYVYLDCTID